MKRITLTFLLAICITMMAFAVTKSQVVVYINGEKFYIHTVESKETIYSIAKTYNVDEQTIIDLNSAELKVGENIKIPFTSTKKAPHEQMSAFKLLRTFSKHTIAHGETLYSISRRYGISIDVIKEDNPSLDPLVLKTGSTILIRRKMKGKTSEEQIKSEWSGYQENLNRAVEAEGYLYHIVKPGETIYSLSRAYGIAEADFIALNGLEGGLKAGSMVKVPTTTQNEDIVEKDEQPSEEESEQAVELPSIEFSSLRAGETLKVALLLPLSDGAKVNRQFADFYQGFVMGLEKVKSSWSRSIELTLINTERSSERVAQIVNGDELDGTDLIVGPIYEDQLSQVVAYAEEHKIPLVSPLGSLKSVQSGAVFQLSPRAADKYDKLAPMLDNTKHVTLVYAGDVDSLFEHSIKQMLGERPYDVHHYKYVHPTVVAKSTSPTAGDLTPFINNDKDNTIVVMSSNETDVDRILSALSSAKVNIVARGGKSPKYAVLGNSEWSRYKNIDRSILFNNNVVLVSSYHAKRDNREVKLFDSAHISKYGTIPSLYTYRGYDAAVIFGEAMYSDVDYKLQGRLFTPLQSHYRFEQDAESGININTEWIKVNYNNNYTITIE